MVVRVEIATLGIVVPNGNLGTISNVRGNAAHTLGVESGLELGRHKAITVAGVAEAHEVDRKHRHVEYDGDDN